VSFTISRPNLNRGGEPFRHAVLSAASTTPSPVAVTVVAPDASDLPIVGTLTKPDRSGCLPIRPDWHVHPDQILSITFHEGGA
jgi:hypothetical protein